MQWIILIGDEQLNLNKIKSIKHTDFLKSYNVSPVRYCVDFGEDHIFYDFTPELADDYEPNELSHIPFGKLQFIMMVYTSENRMKMVLQQNNFLKNIFIDNDDGLIVPIETYIELGMPTA